MAAYYNEIDPYAAQWLRNLIAQNLIAPGDVDERSITDVQPSDLEGYTQCHFFAGIGGWSLAARLAGWPDGREFWTGSPPCQPWSIAGKRKGKEDARDLWPEYFRLIAARRPPVAMGEQVADATGKGWLDRTASDLEGIGYACGAAVVPACAVDAPHRRDRLWFVADASSERRTTRGTMTPNMTGQSLPQRVKSVVRELWPTPTAVTASGGAALCKWGGTASRAKLRRVVTAKELNGALNPAFPSWLMGFPPEWESCAPSAMPSSRKSRQKSSAPTSM